MDNAPIGWISFRSARKNPAACASDRRLLTTDPIAHDTDGIPHGFRLNLASDAGIAWVDMSAGDAAALRDRLTAFLASRP